MRQEFDFEGDEVLAVQALICSRLEQLYALTQERPLTMEELEEVQSLGNFTVKLGPIIQYGKMSSRASLN